MSVEKEIVHEFVKSINEHNVNKIYDLMDNDFKFIDAYGNEETGKDHMRESWIGYFRWFPDYEIEIIDIISDSSIFVILGFASGTYQNEKGENNTNYWRLPAAWRIVVHEHKIKQWQVYCDSKIPFDIIEKNRENASR
jgi:ketosteroid isomerase-like protein